MSIRKVRGGYKASNGRTYVARSSAVRADRRARSSAGSRATKKRKHKRVMRGKRRR